MKTKLTKLSLVLLSCVIYAHQLHAVTPYFSGRSQSVDLSRQVVGVRDIENDLLCSDECWPGYLAATVEFTETFNPKGITRCLFGPIACQSIHVSGSAVANRGTSDWLADNFGLPADFQSTLTFNPLVTNVIWDIQGFMRFDRWCKKLWFYIHAPIVHTKWDLNVCEDVQNIGGVAYPAGYFSPNAVTRPNLTPTASAFLSGQFAPNITGVTFNRLCNARWAVGDCAPLTKTKLADLRMWLGYDWRNCDCYDISVGLVVAAPTGNRPKGDFLFEPIVGNGKHWELGVMVRGDYTAWEDCDGTQAVTLFSQVNITHLFKAKQRRTFDLCGKPLSRYMLAEQLGPNNTFPFLYGNATETTNPCPANTDLGAPVLSNFVFANVLTPVANLTTLCVDVSTNIQVDWVAMATYSRCNFTWDVGYELWYRGCEKIKPRDCGALLAENTWALKGDAQVFGFGLCPNAPFTFGQAVPLGATESGATITSGTNAAATVTAVNAGVDNAQFAFGGATSPTAVAFTTLTAASGVAIDTSIQPVFIKSTDIDLCGARTKGFSNKIFTHVSYYWDCECWEPFIGFGAMGEFATHKSGRSCSTTSSNCGNGNKNCRRCAFSQWGVWVKGGFVFG